MIDDVFDSLKSDYSGDIDAWIPTPRPSLRFDLRGRVKESIDSQAHFGFPLVDSFRQFEVSTSSSDFLSSLTLVVEFEKPTVKSSARSAAGSTSAEARLAAASGSPTNYHAGCANTVGCFGESPLDSVGKSDDPPPFDSVGKDSHGTERGSRTSRDTRVFGREDPELGIDDCWIQQY